DRERRAEEAVRVEPTRARGAAAVQIRRAHEPRIVTVHAPVRRKVACARGAVGVDVTAAVDAVPPRAGPEGAVLVARPGAAGESPRPADGEERGRAVGDRATRDHGCVAAAEVEAGEPEG